MRPDLFCCGYVRLRCPIGQTAALFEALRVLELTPKALQRDEKNGFISFFCSLRAAGRLTAFVPSLSLTRVSEGGVPILLRRLLLRPGLLVGLLLALVITVASGLFVWEVEITGNEQISNEELEQALSMLGLRCGSYVPALDGEALALRLRQLDDRIAYAAVNVSGTVVRVQLRESVRPERPATAPADIVAAKDGVVTLPLAFAGECLVREGEVVRAGQVLVSGTVISEKHGPRTTRAAGRILARTTSVYTVRVPLVYEKKVYTGQVGHELELHFFGFQGKIFKNTGNIKGICDIIINNHAWKLSNGRSLPLWLTSAQALAYRWERATRSAEEALTLAKAELAAQLAADSAERVLLQRWLEVQADAEGVTLICTVVCEEDIGKTVAYTGKETVSP